MSISKDNFGLPQALILVCWNLILNRCEQDMFESVLCNWISTQASLCESYTVALIETQPHRYISSEESGTSVFRILEERRLHQDNKTSRALKRMEEDNNTEEVKGSNDSNWVSKELGKEEDDEEGEY